MNKFNFKKLHKNNLILIPMSQPNSEPSFNAICLDFADLMPSYFGQLYLENNGISLDEIGEQNSSRKCKSCFKPVTMNKLYYIGKFCSYECADIFNDAKKGFVYGIIKDCKICHKSLTVNDYYSRRGICSDECSNILDDVKEGFIFDNTKKCKICSKSLEINDYYSRRKFCSCKCFSVDIKPLPKEIEEMKNLF